MEMNDATKLRKHPVYAKGDPKEGKPLLPGDIVVVGSPSGEKQLQVHHIELCGEQYIVWLSSDMPGELIASSVYDKWSSDPALPSILPCSCRAKDNDMILFRNIALDYQVSCRACGRRGPKDTLKLAIVGWNEDRQSKVNPEVQHV